MYNREAEIREAIDAGERALRSLQEARDNLGSARGWGIIDMLGGRGLSGLIKHVKIGDAKSSLSTLTSPKINSQSSHWHHFQ